MRTLLIILGGVTLLALFLGGAKLIGTAHAIRIAAIAFAIIWFAFTGINVWLGMTKAGYTLVQELPIFLLTFGFPAAVAALVAGKY